VEEEEEEEEGNRCGYVMMGSTECLVEQVK